MDEAEVLQWDGIVHRVARKIGRSYPDLEFEDMKAELWVKLLEADKRFEGFIFVDDLKMVEAKLYHAAREYAAKERQRHLTISPQYGYRTKDLHALFGTFFDHIEWETAEIPEEAYTEYGSDALAMSSDMSRAWDRLPTNYRVIIFREHALHDELTPAERRLLSEAVQRVAEILNTYERR